MIKKLIFILSILTSSSMFSQHEGIDHHMEYGFSMGVSNYTGDLSPTLLESQFSPSGSIFYRHHLKDKISVLRINLQAGILRADESKADFHLLESRGNSFNTSFVEFSGLYEYKFFDFRDIKGMYFMTPYIFGGLGVSVITESEAILVIPFGIGANFAFGKKVNIGFEFGARKAYSDKIDGFDDDVNLSSSHRNDWYYFTGITLSRTVYNSICPD